MEDQVQVPVKPTLALAMEQIEKLIGELAGLNARVLDLETTKKSDALVERVAKLEEVKSSNSSEREMTDDDARRVLTGDHKASKHKDAAKALGLSYGQVYSCRLGYTFKNIHREMKEKGEVNAWAK